MYLRARGSGFVILIFLLSPGICAAPVLFNDPALLGAVKTQWETATGLTLSEPPEDSELANPLFTELIATGLQIVDLTGLEACTALTTLNVGHNKIVDVTPIAGLTALTALELGFENPFLKQQNFDPFETGTNLITDLSPLSGLINLTNLGLGGVDTITDLSVIASMPQLTDLFLAGNPIADWTDLSSRSDTLTSLFMMGACGFTDADMPVLAGLTHLTILMLVSVTGISDISALSTLSLQAAGFSASLVSDISVVANWPNLNFFYMPGAPLTNLDALAGMANLQFAFLDTCELTDISGISGVSSLQWVLLGRNHISDISALAALPQLFYLSLDENQITDIQALVDNPGLGGDDTCTLTNNPFSQDAACTQLPALRAKFNNPNNVQSNAICGPVAALTISVDGTGEVNPGPGIHVYGLGEAVWVNASQIAGSGWAFDHWEGDIGSADPYASSLNLVMDQDRAITAVFLAADWTLTLQKNGNGTTNPLPGVYGYADGHLASVNVTLFSGGDAFSHWTGDLMAGANPQMEWQQVTMDQNRMLTAEFVPGDWILTIAADGGGTCNPYPAPGTYSYMNGHTARVNINNCPGMYFAGWSGDLSGYLPHQELLMDGNKSVTAHYTTSGYTLSTQVQGGGYINFGSNTLGLAEGATLTLVANPWGGWVFDHWEGDVPAEGDETLPSLPVTMDQDRSLTAVFLYDAKMLTIIIDGPGSTNPSGSPDPGTSHEYLTNQMACIQAILDPSIAFSYWSGDIGSANPGQNMLCVIMDQDRTITAHFVTADWTLTLETSGNGTTNPTPGAYGFVEGAQVPVNALLVNGGDAFSHWTGDLMPGASADWEWQSVTMNRNRTLTAEFVTGDWSLTLSKTGSAAGTISPAPGTYMYLDGRTATVSAIGNASAYFAGWTGDIVSDTPFLQTAMDSNKALAANFVDTGYILNIIIDGQGGVNPSGIQYFAAGAEPVLEAITWAGYTFSGWTGDVPEGADPNDPHLPVLMDQNRQITAHFIQELRTLTMILVGEGVTNPASAADPGLQYIYSLDAHVYVIAELGINGWAFSHWSGDIGAADPSTREMFLAMDQDRTLVANYVTADWTLSIDHTGDGDTWPTSGTYGVVDGAIQEVVASIYAGGDAFDHWGGLPEGLDAQENGHTIEVHSDLTLMAVFGTGDYTLTTTVAGSGTAEYVSHPAGVYNYIAGRHANLEVRPNAFTYWGGFSGDVNSFEYFCQLFMDGNKNVTITLGTSGFDLVVNEEGYGITVPSGTRRYMAGAQPVIHAIDNHQSLFDHWTGDLPGGADPYARDIEILMNQNRIVTAIFTQADWYLYIQASGNGTTDPAPDLYFYREGVAFEVTAIPGADTLFLHWQGDVPEGEDPTALTISGAMTQNRELIAVFVPTTVTVPDLMGMTQTEAEAALPASGLILGTVMEEHSNTVPEGQILGQDPASGTDVAYGAAVSIVVSLGPCYTQVVSVIGLIQAEAEAALTAASLILGAITEENSDFVPAGQIISQNPVAGLLVFCESAVNIVISLGIAINIHSADPDGDYQISLSELLRVIQFYNSNGLHCQEGTEDGYAPGPGDTSCTAHSSDYNPQDWRINLSELLRLIQFFNSNGYHACPGEDTEDGFCPGLA
ncbi:MAG TPA: PASTA domain-containing protein [Candidatus Hydrogenedentes bacterium]|nr:PASTA domain-containing protein [Candidatus Hydrogenedentota bacterium]